MTTTAAEPALACVESAVEVLSEIYRRPATAEAIADSLVESDVSLLLAGKSPEHGTLRLQIDEHLAELERRGLLIRTGDGFLRTAFMRGASRRQLVLSLAARAAWTIKRAVRVIDVWRYANTHARVEVRERGLTSVLVTRALTSLTHTGDLIVIGRVRGRPDEGKNLLVPADQFANPIAWLPREALTWMDYVVACIQALVSASMLNDAGAAFTFTTDELARFLRNEQAGNSYPNASTFNVSLEDNRRLTVLLERLAQEENPLIAPVAGRRAAWRSLRMDAQGLLAAPSSGNRFSTDADRVVEAADRVCMREQRLTVTAQDVEDEVNNDPALRLTGRESVAKVLSGLARPVVPTNDGTRKARRSQRIRRVGKAVGGARYLVVKAATQSEWDQAEEEAGGHWVARLLAEERFAQRFLALQRTTSPVIAIGRARQLREDIRTTLRDLPRHGTKASAANDARDDAERILRDVEGWLRFRERRHEGVPDGFARAGRGLTAEELRELFAPLSETVNRMTNNGEVVRHFSRLILRIRNHDFVSLKADSPVASARFLFDPASANAYAAREWGGTMSSLMARWGLEEVGELRDPRFVCTALGRGTKDERVRAIAGIALMQHAGARALLEQIARDGADAAVRESSLWSLGMLIGGAATPILEEAASRDSDRQLRKTAARCLQMGPNWWWRM